MYMFLFFLILPVISDLIKEEFYTQAVVTNQRYKNEDVLWSRPKCLYCGDLVGSDIAQKPNLYPDETSTYFVANIKLELGWKLIIQGRYPYARYLSFTVADQLNDNGQIGNGVFLRGDQIVPDKGSVNPFLPNVNRYSTNRNYTLYLVQGRPPINPLPNTLYTSTTRTHFSIRIYLVDNGITDGTGHNGNGLPIISLIANNQTITGKSLLKILDARKTGDPNGYSLDEWLENIRSSNDPTNAPIIERPRAELFIADQPEQRVRQYPPDDTGGFASNPDTKYIVLPFSFSYGQLLVVTGRKPTHQYTKRNNQYVSNETQVQYFSVSTSAGPCSGQGWHTVYDEEIPEYYTIVVRWPWYRPNNAIKENNVTWLSSGDGEGHYVTARIWVGVLYFRFQNCLSGDDWPESPMNVPMPTNRNPFAQTDEIMQEYYPQAKYMSKEDF